MTWSAVIRVGAMLSLLLLAYSCPRSESSTSISESASLSTIQQSVSAAPIFFTKNVGQWPDSVLYRASVGDYTLWFVANGVYCENIRTRSPIGRGRRSLAVPEKGSESIHGRSGSSDSIGMIKTEFVGSNPDVQVIGEGRLDYKLNYAIGRKTGGGLKAAPCFESIRYVSVYPGLSLVYSASGEGITAEVSGPVSKYHSGVPVVFRKESGEQVNGEDTMVVTTEAGGRLFALGLPVLTGEGGMTVGEASSTSSHGPTYSTLLGGAGDEHLWDMALDSSGCAYLVGTVMSGSFPKVDVEENSLKSEHAGFLCKLSADGSAVLYTTIVGGSGFSELHGVAVDGLGRAYVAGVTTSTDLPLVNAFDTVPDVLPMSEACVMKISQGGDSLLYSSYLGGSDVDEAWGIALDPQGRAYVTGRTYSSDFPVVNAYDAVFNGGIDVFVSRVDSSGRNLLYSTYLGGSGIDEGFGIAVDISGAAYVAGTTESPGFPLINAFDDSFGGGCDAFVAKLSTPGMNLLYSTFLGGAGGDFGTAVALDRNISAYVTGFTMSADFPTANAFSDSLTGYSQVFVTKMSVAGTTLLYSTYLGGNYQNEAYGIAADSSGAAYVTGMTWSENFPVVHGFDGSIGGQIDAFATVVAPSGSSLVYSSYLGGSEEDEGRAVCVNRAGVGVFGGGTHSPDFPLVHPIDSSLEGWWDVFVTKIDPRDWGCCDGITGNVDCDPSDGVDVGDLTALIDNLFINFTPLCCESEANCDGVGGVDVGDVTSLIDNLFINFTPLPTCQ